MLSSAAKYKKVVNNRYSPGPRSPSQHPTIPASSQSLQKWPRSLMEPSQHVSSHSAKSLTTSIPNPNFLCWFHQQQQRHLPLRRQGKHIHAQSEKRAAWPYCSRCCWTSVSSKRVHFVKLLKCKWAVLSREVVNEQPRNMELLQLYLPCLPHTAFYS